MPHFALKVALVLISLGFRLLYFSLDQALPIILQAFMLIFSLITEYLEDQEEMKSAQDLRACKEGLTKFRTLVASDIPSSILILSSDLKQILFKNEALDHNIKVHLSCSDTPKEDLSLLLDWLNCSNIDPHGIGNDDHCDTPHLQNENWSVLHFLEIISRDQTNLTCTHSKHQFNAEFHPSCSIPRKVYHVKVFSLSWDGQEAFAIILDDITHYFQNLTLKVADANKNKMLAMISHELKTPLNGILGVVNILKKELTQPHLLQYLNICKNSGELLLNLVNSILDLQHIRDNKFILKLSKDNLHQLLMDTYDLFKLQFDQKNLDLQLIISPKIPAYIVTDQKRLRQILINLVGNALKFTFKGGVAITASSLSQGYINIKVADTGIGISKEDQKKLFKMYGRLDQPDPSVNTQGTGFGLEISNQLVKLLAGEKDSRGIEVESQQGVGTVFSFNIKDNSELKQGGGSLEDSFETDMKYYEPKVFEENVDDVCARMSAYSLFSSFILNEKPISLENAKPACACFHPHPKRGTAKIENGLQALKLESSELILHNETISPKHSYQQKTRLFTPFNKEQTSPTCCKVPKTIERSKYRMSTCPNSPLKKVHSPLNRATSKILLVDDNPFNLLVARTILEGLKYSIVTALNGKLAIEEVIKETNFCLILMDIQMPVMDGYEATIELRRMMEKKEIPEIPIVALSANDSEDDKRRSKEVGMYTHLSKPLKEESLKTVLGEVLSKTSKGCERIRKSIEKLK